MSYQTIKWTGTQITQPGIYSNIPLELYHNPFICAGTTPLPASMHFGDLTTFGPSISSSGLREIFGEDKSPKHFYARWRGNPAFQPTPEEEEKKRHFVVGRAVHHLLLGERNFAKLFIMQPPEWPDANGELKPWRNSRDVCKAWNRARIAEGRSWLTPKEVESIRQMAISVGNHPLAGGFLRGQIERSIFWQDEETGIWLKARPDSIPTDSHDCADLKTTYSTHWSRLQQSMRQFAYYRQAALVREAFRKVLKINISSFTLVFVEKAPPYNTRDVRPDEEDLDRGDRANRAAIRTFARCLKSGEWPGPGHGNEGNERLPLSPQAREAMDTKLRYEGLADGID